MVWFMKGFANNHDEEFPQMELNFFLKAKKVTEMLHKNGFKISLIEDNEGFENSKK